MIRIVRPAPIAVLTALVDAMPDFDRHELTVLSNGTPIAALERAIVRSAETLCAFNDDDHPLFVWGIADSDDPPVAWMVAATGMIERDKRGYLRATRSELADIMSRWPRFQTRVDARWPKSLRWLEWLGFVKVGEFEFAGRSGLVMEIGGSCLKSC